MVPVQLTGGKYDAGDLKDLMKTYQVFVSHTSDMAGFPEHRPFVQAVFNAVGRARMAPVDMQYFSARDERPADYCRQRVRECEIYIAMVGFRYGSLVPGETISYTELEFRAAGEAGIPRLVFMLEDTGQLPGNLVDANSSAVESFRQRLREGGLIARTFTSRDGLELETFHALTELASERLRLGPAGRAISATPLIWNVPNRNAGFTGRGAVLERLHEELMGDGTAVLLARALYGLGGVGKTQVALEYAYRFKEHYDLIWWIPAEQPQGISLALAELAARLGLKISDNAAEAAATALEQLRRDDAGRWLLIFDNAADPADLEPFLPTGAGHVLITSRNHAWTHHAGPLELDVFTRQESVAHLMRYVPGLALDSAARISGAVGDLPLAIEQAAAWLAETGMPAALYIQQLETQTAKVLGLNKPFGYETPVAAAWNLSLDRLQERSPAAVRLLQLLAFCSPDLISMTLLYGDAMNASLLRFDGTLADKLMVGQLIGHISRLALVKVDQGSKSLRIHRLVQAVIRNQMTEEEQRETKHEVHVILQGARPQQGETDDPANWSAYDMIWAHLGPSQAEECDDSHTRQLLIDWVRYQWKLGEFESCLELAYRLEDLWSHQLGPDHQQTLYLKFHIANVLRSQGRFSEARDLDAFVLERQREVLGPRHPHALMTASGRGGDLRALGDYPHALASDLETYQSFREQCGEDYPRTLSAAFNLACSLRMMGNYSAARHLDQETLDRRRTVLGADHPYTLYSAAALARDMRAEGAFRESADLLRVTLEKYQAVLGDNMLDTLRTAASLAVSLRKSGNLAEAMALVQDTYERYLRRYGKDAPDARSCAVNLASAYAALGNNSRARGLASEVRAAYRSSLDDDHPFTLVATNNLVIYLVATGQLSQARHLAEQTLTAIGSQGRRCRCAVRFPHPPFNPYVRFSRIRLTDDLPGMVTPPSGSGWCRGAGAGRAR